MTEDECKKLRVVENERVKLAMQKSRANATLSESIQERQSKKMKNKIRMQFARKAAKEKVLTPVSSSEVFSNDRSFGKAVSRVTKRLPKSPRKKNAVIRKLAAEMGILSKSPQAAKGPVISVATKTVVHEFYLRAGISYTAPGMKETMTIWTGHLVDREKLSKHYLNMFVYEAHALYCEEVNGTEHNLFLSSFQALRPRNVLTLANTSHMMHVAVKFTRT